MAREDEFRKVAEDVRALARSLARDFREAVDQARASGRPTSEAFRHGLRGMADEARRGMRSNWAGGYYRHHHRHGWRYPPPPRGSWPQAGYGGPPPGPAWGRPRPYWTGPQWPRPPKNRPKSGPLPPLRRRWDATTVLGMLAVLFGVAWLLGALHALSVPVEGVVAIGLMLLGAALIVTGRTDWSLSRHSWPVWLGVGLIAVLVVTSSSLGVGGAINHLTFGNSTQTPTAGKTVYGGFGNLTVNATNLAPGKNVKVESVAGQTFVNTPPDLPVVLHAKVLAGQICVNGVDRQDGVNAELNQVINPSPTASPINIDVHQMFGQVLVDGNGCAHR